MRAFLLLLALYCALPVAAQEVGSRQRVVLSDGRVIVGTVLSAEAEVVVLDVSGLRTEIPRAQIERFAPVTSRFNQQDPNDTRLFLSPTGRTLAKGTGRFSSYLIVLPSVAYGLTGDLDISVAGTIPVDGTGGASVNLKYGLVQNSGTSLALGASAGTSYGANTESGVIGTFYGVATLGSPETSATVGAYGVYTTSSGRTGGFEIGSGLGLTLGLEHQVSNSLKLMAENLFLVALGEEGGRAGIGAAGVRFFGERIAAEVALPLYAFVSDSGGGLTGGVNFLPSPIPFFGVAYNFGR